MKTCVLSSHFGTGIIPIDYGHPLELGRGPITHIGEKKMSRKQVRLELLEERDIVLLTPLKAPLTVKRKSDPTNQFVCIKPNLQVELQDGDSFTIFYHYYWYTLSICIESPSFNKNEGASVNENEEVKLQKSPEIISDDDELLQRNLNKNALRTQTVQTQNRNTNTKHGSKSKKTSTVPVYRSRYFDPNSGEYQPVPKVVKIPSNINYKRKLPLPFEKISTNKVIEEKTQNLKNENIGGDGKTDEEYLEKLKSQYGDEDEKAWAEQKQSQDCTQSNVPKPSLPSTTNSKISHFPRNFSYQIKNK